MSISTTNCQLRISYCTDSANALCTDVNREDKDLVFNLEATEITGGSTGKEEVLLVFAISHASVFSNHHTGIDQFI